MGRPHKLNLAAKSDRDELADDDAETPGRQDCIEGPIVQRTYDKAFGDGSHQDPGQSRRRIGQPCIPAKLCHHEPRIAADGKKAAMGEIHDFKHPKDDQKPGRDGKQYCGGRDDVQNECGHAGLRVASMLPTSGTSLLGASGK
jgi:hypothetical protein